MWQCHESTESLLFLVWVLNCYIFYTHTYVEQNGITRYLHLTLYRCTSRQFDYYLSDMVLALEIRISLGSLLEGKDFVYHWADLTRCKQSVHVLKPASRLSVQIVIWKLDHTV